MAYTLTQAIVNANSAASATHTRTYATNPSNGSLLFAVFFLYSDTVGVTSITDTLGNSWAVRSPTPNASGLGSGGERPWIAAAYCPTGGANTITFNLSGSIGMACSIGEAGGGPASLVVGQINSANGVGSVPSLVLTGVTANAFVIGACAAEDDLTAGSGFTVMRDTNSFWIEHAEYILDNGAAGNRTVDWTPSTRWTAVAVSFDLSGASGVKGLPLRSAVVRSAPL